MTSVRNKKETSSRSCGSIAVTTRSTWSLESLALFDLLKKTDLSANDIKRINKVAVNLLATLKSEKFRVDHWRDKESTRDAVRLVIRDYLWSDEAGLPVDSYAEDEVQAVSEEVYRQVFRAYPTVPSPYYESARST